jgi:hypothetical protein
MNAAMVAAAAIKRLRIYAAAFVVIRFLGERFFGVVASA